MAIFPLAPDQTIAQMWSNGVREGHLGLNRTWIVWTTGQCGLFQCNKL